MNVKKILSIFTVTMVFSSFCQFPVKANAESNNADTVIHGTGAKWEIFCDDYGFSGSNIDGDVIVENIGNRTLPSSYDISINSATAQYFPPIGDQGAIGSCAAFATTYYQFTYEANKLKNEATVSSNIYSPRWTYNYINGGHDDGASLKDAYLVLKNQGAMYNADWTYNGNSASYSFAWPENLPKMREALTYRSKVSNKYVSSSNLDNINTIKSEIASGKVGVICTKSSGWATRYDNNGQKAIVRGSNYGSGSHAMAVVGYDDNYQITVNGQTLTGAFKLANSWGSSWGNNGYVWVVYDALRTTSSYGTQWQTKLNGVREPVFYTNNQFSFIDVYYCDAYFTETLQFTSYDPWILDIYGKNGSYATTQSEYLKKGAIISSDVLQEPDTRYLVFDYTNPGINLNVGSYLSTTWTLNMVGEPGTYNTYNIGARLTDNLGKEIEPFNNVYYSMNNGVYTQTHTSNIALGRVSVYDNQDITTADVDMVQDYLLGYIDFSSLQKYLADYNVDGSVDMSDVVSMLQHIYNSKGMSSVYDTIPGYDYSMADFIERELNISVDDFVNSLR